MTTTTTTKDYGAVVGWWCPGCRIKDDAARDATGAVMPMGCCGRRCIPVYDEIPPGQRPKAKKPDEDAVMRVVLRGTDPVGVGDWTTIDIHGPGLRIAMRQLAGTFVLFDADERRVACGVSLVGAVRYVAEGRLP
jgi:hypothetical protein